MTPTFLVFFLSTHLLCPALTTTTTHPSTAITSPAESQSTLTIHIRHKIPPSSKTSNGGRYSLLNNRVANRRPRKKNLDRDQLMDILGSYFDVRWMSPEEPPPPAREEPEYSASTAASWRRTELDKQVLGLNLSAELGQLGVTTEDPVYVRVFEKWLLKKASCPVRYTWEDIGPLFWPRYVKLGECVSVPGTCSWPPGMHCVPSGTNTLHLLRWQCKVPKVGRAHRNPRKNPKKETRGRGGDWRQHGGTEPPPVHLKCSWIVVPYPVTTDCVCTC